MMSPTLRIVALCIALAAAGCSSSHGAIERARAFEESGNLYLAYHALEDARDPNNPDSELDREYWRVRPLYLMERGRELVYDEREPEALQYFNRVLAIDPDHEQAKLWIDAARTKLARQASRAGDEMRASGQLEEAQKKYAEALNHQPGYPDAERGKQLVAAHFTQRRNKAESKVREGNQDLEEQRNPEAFHSGQVAVDQDPSLPGAHRLYEASQLELADNRERLGRRAEQMGNYAAALLQYRRAKEIVPVLPGIDERIALMEGETEARKLMERATMHVARAIDNPITPEDEVIERLDKANELLREAYDLSELERPALSELMLLVEERRMEHSYFLAGDAERRGRPEVALELYREIDAAVRDGYKDVKARITSLEESIALAEEAFAKGEAAEEAGELQEAIRHYKDVHLFCRNYKGVRARIEELELQQQQ